MASKFWLGALLLAAQGEALADYSFAFAPLAVTAPDSRGFSNSVASGLLTVGTTTAAPPRDFLDTWQFSLAVGADVASFVGSLNFTSGANLVTQGIDNLQLRLVGPGGVSVIGWQNAVNLGGFQQVFSVIAPATYAPGNYALQVRGLLVGGASSYAGTLQAIGTVPVPASLPLMAIGLVVAASTLRQKKT